MIQKGVYNKRHFFKKQGTKLHVENKLLLKTTAKNIILTYIHMRKPRIIYRLLLTMSMNNEIGNFSFCLTTVSIMNVKFIKRKKLLPFILTGWCNQSPKWAPFGCQEIHIWVLLSLTGGETRKVKYSGIWGTVSFDREQSHPEFPKRPYWATLV